MLKLVKPDVKYKKIYEDMMKEWINTGEKIVPYSIVRLDYKKFNDYLEGFEEEKKE